MITDRLVQYLSACAVALATLTTAASAHALDIRWPVGSVYTMSNAREGNSVIAFDRMARGELALVGSFPTGGSGTGEGLGNQNGVVLSEDQDWLFAVNAGSDSLSVFAVQRKGLRLVDTVSSGGSRPISVTEHDGLVYVLNAGSDSIQGFRMRPSGRLQPLAGSHVGLSGSATNPAQVQFVRNGRVLVVTEKDTQQITSYVVDRDGVARSRKVFPSSGMTPFGFAEGRSGQLFVSEAFGGAENASAVSSYRVSREGELSVVTASEPTMQTAACWVALTPDGRFVYTTNTGSSSVSGYVVDFDGELTLLDDDGQTGLTGEGSRPVDIALSRGGRFAYVLSAANGTIAGFRVGLDGSLESSGLTTLPAGANGLAAR